jgi:predicted AlkP superfamily phosphohydrolase/phosphomutase
MPLKLVELPRVSGGFKHKSGDQSGSKASRIGAASIRAIKHPSNNHQTRRFVMGEALEQLAERLREELKTIEDELRQSMSDRRYSGEQAYPGQHSDMKAQTMLAIGHIEDARMRCGKILQYADDGVSVFDK